MRMPRRSPPPPFRLPIQPRPHALLTPLAVAAFAEVRLTVALYDARGWHAMNIAPSLIPFERQHGVERGRYEYNDRCMTEVVRTRRTLLGTYAGLKDLFVPVVVGDSVCGVLAAGPFMTSPPTSSDLLDRFRWLTGRHGRLSDPEFADYVSATLSTP